VTITGRSREADDENEAQDYPTCVVWACEWGWEGDERGMIRSMMRQSKEDVRVWWGGGGGWGWVGGGEAMRLGLANKTITRRYEDAISTQPACQCHHHNTMPAVVLQPSF